jgi:hypothetical protein
MFLGQYAPAIAAANELIETMPEEMLRPFLTADGRFL